MFVQESNADEVAVRSGRALVRVILFKLCTTCALSVLVISSKRVKPMCMLTAVEVEGFHWSCCARPLVTAGVLCAKGTGC